MPAKFGARLLGAVVLFVAAHSVFSPPRAVAETIDLTTVSSARVKELPTGQFASQEEPSRVDPWDYVDLEQLFGRRAAHRRSQVIVTSTPDLPLLQSWFDAGGEGRQAILSPPK